MTVCIQSGPHLCGHSEPLYPSCAYVWVAAFPISVLAAISDGGVFQTHGTGTVFIDQETDGQSQPSLEST